MATTGTTIDTLQVNITANAQSATSALKSLAGALQKVRTALTGMKDGVSVSQHLTQSFKEMNGALNKINETGVHKLQSLASALGTYADSIKKIKSFKSGSITQSVKDAQKAVGLTKKDGAKSTGASAKISQTSDSLKQIGKEADKAGKKAKHAIGLFGKLFKTIGRIAMYRAIRAAMKAISEAFSEGLKNAYGYSKTSESFKRLAETLDRIKSITSQMINQIGAFWGEVKQFALPAIEWIVDKVRFLFEYLTELFAALNGQNTYLRAKYEAKEWDEAIGKAKEYKHQLLGIDEINNLSDQKKSGTKADDTDYSKLYEEVKVSKKLKKLADTLKEITSALTIAINDLNPFKAGTSLSKKTIWKLIKPALFGLAGAFIGFKYGGAKGALIGLTIGASVGLILNGLDKAKASGEQSQKALYKAIQPALSALTGLWIGWKIGKGKGALVGATIGLTVGFLLNAFDDASNNGVTAEGLLHSLYPVLNGLALGVILFGITKKASGMMLGITIGSILTFAIQELFSEGNGTGYSKSGLFELFKPSMISWGLAGGFIGFKLGGIKGALVGFTIGCTITWLIQAMDVTRGDNIKNNDVFAAVQGTNNIKGSYEEGELLDAIKRGEVEGLPAGGDYRFDQYGNIHSSDSGTFAVDPTVEKKNGNQTVGNKVLTAVGDLWHVNEGGAVRGAVTVDNDGNPIVQNIPLDRTGKYTKVKEINGQIVLTYDKDINGVKVHGGKLAMGGIPASGSLFFAGESGAEFVGNIGSTSAVANTGQMTDAIYKAAYMGMSKALKENGNGNMSGWEASTTDEIFAVMRKKASNYNKRTGNPAFA